MAEMGSSEHRELVWKLDKMFMVRRIMMNKMAGDAGLYMGQLPILAYISHNKNCTQKEIADWLGVSAASVALSTKRLQKQGFIEKTVDSENLRRNMLSVTEKGCETAYSHRRRAVEFDEKMLAGLSEEELVSLSHIMDVLIRNMTGDEPVEPDFQPMHEMDSLIRQKLREKGEQ